MALLVVFAGGGGVHPLCYQLNRRPHEKSRSPSLPVGSLPLAHSSYQGLAVRPCKFQASQGEGQSAFLDIDKGMTVNQPVITTV